MRKILFRGKRDDNKCWVYGLLTSDFLENPNPYIVNKKGKHRVAHKSVSQYSGLNDKNGNKIFDGDIVKYRHKIGVINYNEIEAMFVVNFRCLETDFHHIFGGACEIIGNIHDNPELLEV